MRVLICSGRFYADTHTITHVLDLYARTQTINVLIHGGHQALGGAIENWATVWTEIRLFLHRSTGMNC